MKVSLPMIFSIFLISSLVLVSSVQNSFADEVIATSLGFEDSTILELKSSRGNEANINSVRIWLSEDNEFKSFKTEQGWMGKKQLNGVIEFTTQNNIKPGESVKFGIKTLENNPIINWKALDPTGEVVSTASTKITIKDPDGNTELNKPKIVSIKDESIFRLIPEKPISGSDFRVVGENFVPDQTLDFYIGNNLQKSITIDSDGKILFTSQVPVTKNDERTEFILRDSGGKEKTVSIRIPNLENREIPDEIKLSLASTPQQVKRGETIKLTGMGTPNTTLTITSKQPDGDILAINTIQTGFDGKWSFDNLFSPEIDLGMVSIEIDDGKNIALRNIEVITAKVINVVSVDTMIQPGNTIVFAGEAIPNQEMSVIIEDSIGAEIFSRTINVGESGVVNFNVEIPRGSVEGTYVLLAFQGEEEGVSTFGVGQEPEPILILRPLKLNFPAGENAKVSIQGPVNSQISIILIDSGDREKFSESINLGPDGKEIYEINTDDLATGAYTLNGKRGESSGSAVFTVGLSTGSGAITIQTTKSEYSQGEQILILGNTGSINVLLDITIKDPNGTVVKKIGTFSDRFGVFKIDNFRIPSDGENGMWTINAKSGGNFKETTFNVAGDRDELIIFLDKGSYEKKELVNISGDGARMSSTVTIKILNSEGIQVDELNITAKSNGEFATIWSIPLELVGGEFEIIADDGSTNSSIKFMINE